MSKFIGFKYMPWELVDWELGALCSLIEFYEEEKENESNLLTEMSKAFGM